MTWSGGGGSRRTWSWRKDHASHHLSHAYGLDKWFHRWSGGPFEALLFLTWISQESSQWRNLQTAWSGTKSRQGPHYGPGGRALHRHLWSSAHGRAHAVHRGSRQTRWACESSTRVRSSVQLKKACQKLPAGSTAMNCFVLFPDASRFSHGGLEVVMWYSSSNSARIRPLKLLPHFSGRHFLDLALKAPWGPLSMTTSAPHVRHHLCSTRRHFGGLCRLSSSEETTVASLAQQFCVTCAADVAPSDIDLTRLKKTKAAVQVPLSSRKQNRGPGSDWFLTNIVEERFWRHPTCIPTSKPTESAKFLQLNAVGAAIRL